MTRVLSDVCFIMALSLGSFEEAELSTFYLLLYTVN